MLGEAGAVEIEDGGFVTGVEGGEPGGEFGGDGVVGGEGDSGLFGNRAGLGS